MVYLVRMSDFFGKIRSGAEKVAREADEFAHVKRIEMEIGSIKKQVEDNYKKLGEMTYRSSVNKEPENPAEAKSIMANITDLNKQITVKEEEIKKLQGAGAQPAPQTPPPPPETSKPSTTGKKVCANCGTENNEGAKFCFQCGAKMS